MDHSPTESTDLIEKIYASALEPGRYDELMSAWQSHVETAIGRLPEDVRERAEESAAALRNSELERHFLRAFSILERLGRNEDDSRSIEALIEVNAQPAMLVSQDGRIVAANGPASEILGARAERPVYELELDADGEANLRTGLCDLAEKQVGRLLAISRAVSRDGSATFVLALTRAQRPPGAPPIGLVTVADLTWTDRVGEMLKQAFALTDAECDIARALVAGRSLREIARLRNTRELTVRTQAKTLLRKVDVRSQSDLIRLAAALVQFDVIGRRPEPATGTARMVTMMRQGGRRLSVATVGPADGRPVAFIHGMLDGHGVTTACLDLLEQRNIRLIAPVRPCFGDSDPDGGPEGAAERFAADLEAVFDEMRVEHCPVIGHMAGSVYAFAAASRLGQRISGVVAASGGVPIVSRAQFAMMTPRQRIVAYTARYAPALLPLILRAGIALLDSGGDHAFMKALYETAPLDYRVARQPEVFARLTDGYRFTVRQGHGAFEVDSWQVTRDWSRFVAAATQPVILVHGRHDPVVRIETVRDFARRVGQRARLVEVEDQGQLVFYARPEIILDAVEEMLAQ
jgi:pimeloyl-ACP methyl ester carboxylesterase/DNA-binding CsgD family transcriptional regulator/PAS domain-containing protein